MLLRSRRVTIALVLAISAPAVLFTTAPFSNSHATASAAVAPPSSHAPSLGAALPSPVSPTPTRPTPPSTAVATKPAAKAAAKPAKPASLSRAKVHGLKTQNATRAGKALHGSYPTVTGIPAVGAAARQLFAAEAKHLAALPRAKRGTESISYSIVGASPQALGIRYLLDRRVASRSTAVRAQWYSPSTHRAISDGALFHRGINSQLATAIAQSLRTQHLALGGVAALKRFHPAYSFTARGELIVEFDSGTVDPHRNGLVSAVIPRSQTIRLLSKVGRQAQSSATNPRPTLPAKAQPAKAPAAPAKTQPGSTDCARTACVALTFDDGPSANTDQLLAILAAKHVTATFFVVGSEVASHPSQMRAIVAAGHVVGNHTWDHSDLTTLTPAQERGEIGRTDQQVFELTGHHTTLLRPPYGARNPSTDAASPLPVILWSVDPSDWRIRNTAAVTASVLAAAGPGSIILLHETRPTTVAAVGAIIDGLRSKGLAPVTVPELLGGKLRLGHAYFSR